MTTHSTVPDKAKKKPVIIGHRWKDHTVFTVEEAGEILRLSRPSAYKAARTGELPNVLIGRRRLVPRAALEQLLLGGAVPSASVV